MTNHEKFCIKPCISLAPNISVKNQFYSQGEIQNGEKYFYATDHLGSVTDLLDMNGNNVASIDYAPYGRKVKQTGVVKPSFGFAGMFEHGTSGLNLTWYRAYSARDGRWLSEDPIGFEGGGNLFGYVKGKVISQVDLLGLWGIYGGIGGGGALGVGYEGWIGSFASPDATSNCRAGTYASWGRNWGFGVGAGVQFGVFFGNGTEYFTGKGTTFGGELVGHSISVSFGNNINEGFFGITGIGYSIGIPTKVKVQGVGTESDTTILKPQKGPGFENAPF